MKKFLMTGIAAISICAAFTSCSKDADYEQMTKEEMSEANYQTAFTSRFGEIAPNHDWGFEHFREGVTRSYNPDANIWGSTYHLDVPQVLTREQKNRVIAYFQNNQFLVGGGSKDLTEYFVQQVYKGGEENGAYVNILNTDPALTTEKYKSSGMSTPAWGSNHMDRLYANNNPDDHMGNYNNGQMSWNYNVENTNSQITYLNPTGNGQHADQIQYMYGTRATGFGYHESETSKDYSDHYVLVDGSVIDAWAEQYGGGIGASVSGRAFVGFDYDLLTPADWYTNDNFKITDLHSGITLYTEGNQTKTLAEGGIAGDYIYNGQPVKYLHPDASNMISGERITDVKNKCGKEDLQNPHGTTFNKTYIDNLIRDGYRPVKDDEGTWVKPEITRDYYYSDWIVCIIPGKSGNNELPDPDVRVFAEDLAISQTINGKVYKGDFDFNDVVFDVIYNDGEGNTWIILQAAGGTYHIEVDGVDVHQQFDVPDNQMVNTWGYGSINKSPVPVKLTKKYSDANKIPIVVTLPNETRTLEAGVGKAPHKLAVPPGTNWASERQSIEYLYPTFYQWVKDPNHKWWVEKYN